MDREQQAARIQRIVNTLAERSLGMPPETRMAFVQEEVTKVREAFRQTYEADPRLRACAMELVDSMTGSIEARVRELEAEASGKPEADEGRAEPES
jgi:hypothetical protein